MLKLSDIYAFIIKKDTSHQNKNLGEMAWKKARKHEYENGYGYVYGYDTEIQAIFKKL